MVPKECAKDDVERILNLLREADASIPVTLYDYGCNPTAALKSEPFQPTTNLIEEIKAYAKLF